MRLMSRLHELCITLVVCGMQSERLLVGSLSSDLLQVLYLQSSSSVWLTLLLIQIKELALLHARVLLLCQHFTAARSVGVP